MKKIFLFWALLVPVLGVGQVSHPDTSRVDTADVEGEVDSLLKIASVYEDQEEYQKMLDVATLAASIAREGLGEMSSRYGECLMYQADAISYTEKMQESEHIYIKAKEILAQTIGKKHPDYAVCLNNLASLYWSLGKYDSAESVMIEALNIRKKALGQEHPDYVQSLNNLASLYNYTGKYNLAEPLFIEAINILENTTGKNNSDYCQILMNLGWLYDALNRIDEAETLYKKAKNILESLTGDNDIMYSLCINNLAVLYIRTDQYELAEILCNKVKNLYEKKLGRNHPNYATALNNLAGIYRELGHFHLAENLYEEAKDIYRKSLGVDHPDYALVLNNMAEIYSCVGNFKNAESLYIESKEIRKRNLGKDHPDYASSLNNLASLYREMGRYELAEPLFIEAQDIYAKSVGMNHSHYATCIDNLAVLYSDMGQYKKAESLLIEAKNIREELFGQRGSLFALSLNNLACLYEGLDSNKIAKAFFLEAKNIFEESVGKENIKYTRVIFNLCKISQKENDFSQMISYLFNYSELIKNYLKTSSIYQNNFDLQNNLIKYRSQLDYCFSLNNSYSNDGLFAESYSNALFFKGFALEASLYIERLLLNAPDSLKAINLKWKAHNRLLAKEYAKPIYVRDSILVSRLEKESKFFENEILSTVADFGYARKIVIWQEVRDQLKKDEAAIEFVHYHYYDQKANATDSTMYAALVQLPGNAAPHFIPLCEARQLDVIFNQNTSPSLYYQNIYNADGSGSSPLYRLLWAPLEPHLQGVKTVYFSPSGLLHRLNLAAIQPVRRETLGDRYHLVVMGSTRNLVVPPVVSPAGNTAALFGGIQYEMDSTKIAMTNQDTAINDLATRGSGGFIYTDSTLRGGAWNYLPATEKEIAITDTILKNSGFETGVYRDYTATEEALQKIGNGKSPSPRVLHIATHGFFFPDPKSKVDNKRLMVDGSEPVFRISDNPMIRSGLLLAGANHAWKTGKPLRPGMEDGILTAYEISQMNLRNTELVVLSACETGLGDIQGNEGVYGLQRAFKIAGAKYLLMSLWQVPDKHTQELMEAFYKNWLDGGKSIPEAFRLAQAEMRAKYPNPFYWAGFVLVE